jgi:hypothetical protein
VKCIKGLESINPEEFLNDGMNYQVYRAKQNVIKHYQAMDDMAALNQLL